MNLGPIRLGVNIDHVATVRQARRRGEPGPGAPDIQQIDVSKALGAQAGEIQTARYSEAKTPVNQARELDALKTAAAHARDRGLAVHAGHGLNYANVQAVARIPGMQELNIGHS